MLVRYLLDKLATTHVVIFALLPRNTPTSGNHNQPSIFTPAINQVNAGLK